MRSLTLAAIVTRTLIFCLTAVSIAAIDTNSQFRYSLWTVAQAQTATNSNVRVKQLYEQGVKQFRNGQYQQALHSYQQVLAMESENGNNAGVGRVLNSIGAVYSEQEQYYQALEVYQGSLAIRRQLQDRSGTARTLYNIGVVYQELQQVAQGQRSLTQAMAIFQTIGDKVGLAATKEALTPTQPRLESGFSTGIILVDEYEAEGLNPPVGVFSTKPPASTPPANTVPSNVNPAPSSGSIGPI